MGIVALPSFGSDPVTVTAAGLDGKVDPLATEFNGSIDNDNIKASAGIVYSKLTLTGSIVNADISGSAAIAASKVDLGTIAQDINEAKGADVASDTTTTIWVTDGNFIHITGTTTITSFGTAPQAGAERTIVFDGILTLTHNATSLILPGGANITTAAGDRAIVRAETTSNARVISYTKADGTPVSGVSTAATQAQMEAASSTATVVTPGRTHFHPGVAKAWCVFDGTATGTNAPTAGYGVTSVTRNGTGDYTVNFSITFSSSDYCVNANALHATKKAMTNIVAQNATTTQFTVTENASSVFDATKAYFMAFGDI